MTKCAKLSSYTHKNVHKLAVIDKFVKKRVYKKAILTDPCGKLRTICYPSFIAMLKRSILRFVSMSSFPGKNNPKQFTLDKSNLCISDRLLFKLFDSWAPFLFRCRVNENTHFNSIRSKFEKSFKALASDIGKNIKRVALT